MTHIHQGTMLLIALALCWGVWSVKRDTGFIASIIHDSLEDGEDDPEDAEGIETDGPEVIESGQIMGFHSHCNRGQ